MRNGIICVFLSAVITLGAVSCAGNVKQSGDYDSCSDIENSDSRRDDDSTESGSESSSESGDDAPTDDGREIKTDGQTYKGGDVVYPDELWKTPEYNYEPSLDFGGENTDGVKGLFFTSPVKYNGKKTRIAAYIGFPKNADKQHKVPAIVLVHGAIGTAVPEWVKTWNDRGFAAISLDVEGGEPTEGICNADTTFHKERNRYAESSEYTAGPSNAAFGDGRQLLENQWFYHATSAVIAAASLISSFDCVDVGKIGVTGISWGSVVTASVIGYDDRFTFAMPVYGGITLSESCSGLKNEFKSPYTATNDEETGEIMRRRWDTLAALSQSKCKTFFVTSTADPFFSMDIASRCSEASNGAVAYKFDFPHSQEVGANEENLYDFAKFAIKDKTAEFVEITSSPDIKNPKLTYRVYGGARVDSITLYYTAATETNGAASWRNKTVAVKDGDSPEYELDIPEAANAFVSIKYGDKQVCSYIFAGKKSVMPTDEEIDKIPTVRAADINDDFTAGGKTVENSNVFEYYHVTNHDKSGNINYAEALLPATVMQHNMDAGDGYITYEISAGSGEYIKRLNVNFKARYAHMGGIYWWNSDKTKSGANELGANLFIEYSYDNKNFEKIYDLNEDNKDENGNGYIVTHNLDNSDCIIEADVNLTKHAFGKDKIYVRFYLKHFSVDDFNYADWKEKGGVQYNNFGIELYRSGYKAEFA